MESDEYERFREPIKCFIPVCPNSNVNRPDLTFTPIRKELKESWCGLVGRNCPKRTIYCCGDHLDLEEDLEAYGRKRRLKLTAPLKNYTVRPLVEVESECIGPVEKILKMNAQQMTSSNQKTNVSGGVAETVTGYISDQVNVNRSKGGKITGKATRIINMEGTDSVNHKSAKQRKEQRLLEMDTIGIIGGSSENLSIQNEDLRIIENVNGNFEFIDVSSIQNKDFSKDNDDLSDRIGSSKDSSNKETFLRIIEKKITPNKIKPQVYGINRSAPRHRDVAATKTPTSRSQANQEKHSTMNQNTKQNSTTTKEQNILNKLPSRRPKSFKSNQERNPTSLNSSPVSEVGSQLRVFSGTGQNQGTHLVNSKLETSENNAANTIPLYKKITAVENIQRTEESTENDGGNTIADEECIPALKCRKTVESDAENPKTITIPNLALLIQPPHDLNTPPSNSTPPESTNNVRHVVTTNGPRSICQIQQNGITENNVRLDTTNGNPRPICQIERNRITENNVRLVDTSNGTRNPRSICQVEQNETTYNNVRHVDTTNGNPRPICQIEQNGITENNVRLVDTSNSTRNPRSIGQVQQKETTYNNVRHVDTTNGNPRPICQIERNGITENNVRLVDTSNGTRNPRSICQVQQNGITENNVRHADTTNGNPRSICQIQQNGTENNVRYVDTTNGNPRYPIQYICPIQDEGITNTPIVTKPTLASHIVNTQFFNNEASMFNVDPIIIFPKNHLEWVMFNKRRWNFINNINTKKPIRNINENGQTIQNKAQYFYNTLTKTICEVPHSNKPAEPQNVHKEPISLPIHVKMAKKSENTSKIILQKDIETNTSNMISVLNENTKSILQKQTVTKNKEQFFCNRLTRTMTPVVVKPNPSEPTTLKKLVLFPNDVRVTKRNSIPTSIQQKEFETNKSTTIVTILDENPKSIMQQNEFEMNKSTQMMPILDENPKSKIQQQPIETIERTTMLSILDENPTSRIQHKQIEMNKSTTMMSILDENPTSRIQQKQIEMNKSTTMMSILDENPTTRIHQNQIAMNKSTTMMSILDENPTSGIQQKQIETNNDDESMKQLMDESELKQLLLLAEKNPIESLKSSQSNKETNITTTESENEIEIKTDPDDDEIEQKLKLVQESEEAIISLRCKVPETITSSLDVQLNVLGSGEIKTEDSTNLNFTDEMSNVATTNRVLMTDSNELGQKQTDYCVDVPASEDDEIKIQDSNITNQVLNCVKDKAQITDISKGQKQTDSHLVPIVIKRRQVINVGLNNWKNELTLQHKIQNGLNGRMVKKVAAVEKLNDILAKKVAILKLNSLKTQVNRWKQSFKLKCDSNGKMRLVPDRTNDENVSNGGESDSFNDDEPKVVEETVPAINLNFSDDECENFETLDDLDNDYEDVETLDENLLAEDVIAEDEAIGTVDDDVIKAKENDTIEHEDHVAIQAVYDGAIRALDYVVMGAVDNDTIEDNEAIKAVDDDTIKTEDDDTIEAIDDVVIKEEDYVIRSIDYDAIGKIDDVVIKEEDDATRAVDDAIGAVDNAIGAVHDDAVKSEDDDTIGAIDDDTARTVNDYAMKAVDDAVRSIDDDVIGEIDDDVIGEIDDVVIKEEDDAVEAIDDETTRAVNDNAIKVVHNDIKAEDDDAIRSINDDTIGAIVNGDLGAVDNTIEAIDNVFIKAKDDDALGIIVDVVTKAEENDTEAVGVDAVVDFDQSDRNSSSSAMKINTTDHLFWTNTNDQNTKDGRISTKSQGTKNAKTNTKQAAKPSRHGSRNHKEKSNRTIVRRQIKQAYKNCVYTDPQTGVKSHVCRFCDKKFTTRTVLMRHEAGFCAMNINIDDPNLVRCEACFNQFSCSHTLRRHTSTFCHKTRDSRFYCKRCSRVFQSQLSVDQHFNALHSISKRKEKVAFRSNISNEREYTCDYCQRNFPEKHRLKLHIRRGHTGTTIPCPICKRKFVRHSKMMEHYEKHKHAKKYSCTVCNNQFKYRASMRQHMNGVCSADSVKRRPFLCDICKKRFPNKKLTELHMIKNHTQSYPCGICNKNFNNKARLSRHLIIHSMKYFCEICNRSFRCENQYSIHKKTHLKVLCDCGQNFNLCYEYYRHRKYWCPLTTGKDFEDIIRTDEKLSQAFRDNVAKVEAAKQESKKGKTKNKAKKTSKHEGIESENKQTNLKNNNDENNMRTKIDDASKQPNNRKKSDINKIEVNSSEEQITTRPRKRKIEEGMSKTFLDLKVNLSKDNKLLNVEENLSYNSKLSNKLDIAKLLDEKAPQIIQEEKGVSKNIKSKRRHTNGNKSKASKIS